MSEPGAARPRTKQWEMLTAEFTDDVTTLGDDMHDELLAALAEAEAENKALRDEVSRLEDENRMLAKAVYQ